MAEVESGGIIGWCGYGKGERCEYRSAAPPEKNTGEWQVQVRIVFDDGRTTEWESALYGWQPYERTARQRFADRNLIAIENGDMVVLDDATKAYAWEEIEKQAERARVRTAEAEAARAELTRVHEELLATNKNLTECIAELKGKRIRLNVPTDKRDQVTIDATDYGTFALHRALNWDDKRRRIYRVSVTATGQALPGDWASQAQAKAYIVALDGIDLTAHTAREGSKRRTTMQQQILAAKAMAENYRR